MFKRIEFPNSYVIVAAMIFISAILTWFLPGGEYLNIDGQMVYTSVSAIPQTHQIFTSLFEGFEKQSGIIAFILIIGGTFWIINHTKAIDLGILDFITFSKKLERFSLLKRIGVNNLILTLIMFMFALFGAIFGMSEETIAFIAIIVPMVISMGYDSITGVAVVFVAAGLGFAGAMLNPFTIGIAQGLAGIPTFSGLEFRIVVFFIITAIGITYILRYAIKIRKKPTLSSMHKEDKEWHTHNSTKDNEVALESKGINYNKWGVFIILSLILVVYSFRYSVSNIKIGETVYTLWVIPIITTLFIVTGILSMKKRNHYFILNLLGFTILFLIIGVMGYEWYIMEIATLFLVLGLSTGIVSRYKANKISTLFVEGCGDILSAALVVGFASGIIIVLENGKVLGYILNSVASLMDGMGNIAVVSTMYVIQTGLNIIMPSGSAKAALTIPILSPLSDLVGLSKQSMVMAFQLGDGMTNLITPTSGILLAVLGIAKVSYAKWLKWVLPLIIILFILGLLVVITTVIFKFPGF